MAEDQDDRLETELSLLHQMYPDQVVWAHSLRELKYTCDANSFQLRIPDRYLVNELPEILSANIGKKDVRQKLKQLVQSYDTGEEILDSIIWAFTSVIETDAANQTSDSNSASEANESSGKDLSKATIVVWLHHLLNTNKRKQALSPSSPRVSGVTKPGYPGVLVYSGPAKAVHEQVNELKHLNWQAFQVRLETELEWTFSHGQGVKELEAMKDVVAEIGDEHKEEFMEAMRMK